MDNVKLWLPTFSLIAEDKDITDEVARYLTDLTFIDYGATSENPQSDKLTLNLVSPTMALPKKGAKLRLGLGFGDNLVNKGVFIVDEVSLRGPPRTLSISAIALPGSNALHPHNMQSQKNRGWDDASIGEIVKTIATENGLIASVSEELRDIMPGHLDQTYENDGEFLARLARQYNAISKATGGYWVFMVQGSGKSASGNSLPEITLTSDGKKDWQFTHRSKSSSSTATAKGNKGTLLVPYHNTATGAHGVVKYGSGLPEVTSYWTQPSKDEAEKFILSRQQDEARAAAMAEGQKKPSPEYLMSMSITQPATPELLMLTPESRIITEGFDPQADRTWIVDNIAFYLSPSEGMSVSMSLKK